MWTLVTLIVLIITYFISKFTYYHPSYKSQPQYSYLRNYTGWNDHNESVIRNIALTKEEINMFERDGFLIVRNAIPVDIIDNLYDSKPNNSLSLFSFFGNLMLSFTNTLFTFDCLWSSIDIYRDLWYFTPIIKYYISPIFDNVNQKSNTSIRLLTDFLFGIQLKPVPLSTFHQDIASFNMIDDKSIGISIWIPLQDINSSQYGGSIIMLNKSYSKFIDINTIDNIINDNNTVLIQYFNKGDILLFDKFNIHKSQALFTNKSIMRYSYAARFFDGDNAYFNNTFPKQFMQKKISCKHNLKYGELLHSPCYPQLYPKILINETQIIMNNQVQYPSNDVHFLSCLFRTFLKLLNIFN